MIAVGGHPGRLPIPGVELALTYEGLRGLTVLPASAAIVGGADTGCQLVSILADSGVDVTLIEAGPRIIAHAENDVSEALVESFRSLVPAFPTFTEGITAAAQAIVRHMGIAPSAPTWGEPRAADSPPRA